MLSSQILFSAFLGGVVPTFFWLWFWTREDKKHPEPRHLLLASFLFGMVGVLAAIPLEKAVTAITNVPITIFVGWAIIEEMIKYGAAYLGGMHTQAEDEPIDAMIYIITAALGFAAAENTLFLLRPFIQGEIFTGIITSNIRFVGTTLLHILSSSLIGAALAFSFFKNKEVQIEHVLIGLSGAVALHAVFNFFIIQAEPRGMFFIFACIWIAIIGLLILFEQVKRIHRKKSLH